MTEKNKYTAKIIYLIVILLLLFPLYFIGQPVVQKKTDDGGTISKGGMLATMRSEAGLSDAELGKIDPTSSTLQLSTFGMRGIALALLWHKSLDQEKKHDWNNVIATSNQIMILEPHFTPVWEFLGWKLAYNASADVDDYRERYSWVIRGFEFLTRGTEYNKTSPILFNKAGWTISQKIGIADENEQYRQLFREDDEFHDIYHTPSLAERDNWLFGIRWYKEAERLFEMHEASGKLDSINKMTRLLFYANSRMNLIHFAEWFEKDGKFYEKAQEHWATAEKVWREFANLEVVTTIPDREDPTKRRKTSLGLAIKAEQRQREIEKEIEGMLETPLKEMYLERWNSLNDLEKASMIDTLTSSFYDKNKEIVVVREYLDQTMPDWKTKLLEERDAIITDPEQIRIRNVPSVLRTAEETELVEKPERELSQAAAAAHTKLLIPLQELVLDVRKDDFGKADDLKQDYDKLEQERTFSAMYRDILNYANHEQQTKMEQLQEAVDARRDRYEGRKRYFEGDIQKADEGHLNAMKKWVEMINRTKPDFDYVADPQFRRDFLELAEKYKVIRDKPEFEGFYPDNFPFEFIVRYECEEQMQTKGLTKALDFAKKAFDEGKYEDAKRYAEKLAGMWFGTMEGTTYLKGVPVPDYRDQMIDIMAIYVRSIRKTGEEYQPNFPLNVFINQVILRDPLVIDALNKTAAVLSGESLKDEDFKKLLDDAVAAWPPVIEKFPILSVPEEQFVDRANLLSSASFIELRKNIRTLAVLYKQFAEKSGTPVPSGFPLTDF